MSEPTTSELVERVRAGIGWSQEPSDEEYIEDQRQADAALTTLADRVKEESATKWSAREQLQKAESRVEELEREHGRLGIALEGERSGAKIDYARAERAEARIEELERELENLHAAFPIYDSLARAEARVARLEEALRSAIADVESLQPTILDAKGGDGLLRDLRAALAHKEEK